MKILRRRLVLGSGALLSAPRTFAQARPQHRVAFLTGASRADSAVNLGALLESLRELGYREGDNLVLDARYGDYSEGRTSALAAEIAALKPAVIVATGSGIAPACALSPPLPVVFLHSGNPVDAGYADSLSHPGRNATGISLLALDLIVKRMQFLQEIRPGLHRIAFLASPEHPGQKRELAASHAAAQQLGVEVAYLEARTPGELAAGLPAVVTSKPDGALLFSDALMIGQRNPLAEFFLNHRIPSAAGWSAFPDSGHLLSYGPERLAAWRRLAQFVDKILRGARPADLPIELPTVFELVINLRTAKAMGLTVPPITLARADRVVQ
jgi:putative ABC transport system substrate-binding protein